MIDISRDRVTGEWLFLDTIKARSTRIASTHRMSVERGRRVFSA